MQKYVIGLCDSDTCYVMNFMEYVNMNEDIPLKITVFSDVNAIKNYTKQDKLDLILLDENITCDKNDIQILKLTDNRDFISENTIYKYQSIIKISKQIVKIVSKNRAYTDVNTLSCAVYSPLGRCGKTTLAKGICSFYQNCLYIGLEEYAGFLPGEYKNDDYRDLYERFMYYLVSENTLIDTTLKQLKCVDGARCFISLNYMDVKQITAHNIEWLLNTVKNDNYKRIVFDIGVGALQDISILNRMDRILVPVLQDEVSKEKIEGFKKLIERETTSSINDKIYYVEVPDADFRSETIRDLIAGGNM